MEIKLEIETTEETIDLLNRIMIQLVKEKGNGLSDKQKDLIEKFRLKMILPVVVDSEYPLSEAFLRYFGAKIPE